MIFEKIYNKGQAQLFKNRYLEFLTKTHPLVIWAMYIPVIIYFLYYALVGLNTAAFTVTIIFIAGLLFWTFFEYIIHRFIFHWISDNPRTKKVAYIMHGNHHEFPRDRQRLFMPPLPSVILASIIFVIMFALLGNNAFAFFPGFILGYLLYASMHYAIHAWHPPFKWLKPIWRNHHLHHYKADDKGFGVSTHFWDKIFGTSFDLKKEKDDKAEVQKLMFDK
jgi:sterol desaturase/sphingolipid hydroxylase (fatty acid hydroxylase superfamily)